MTTWSTRSVLAPLLIFCASCSGGGSNNGTSAPSTAAAKLAVLTQPVGTTSGAVLTAQPVVELQTAAGARATAATNAVTVSIASGTATLGGTIAVNAVGGVATFTNLSVNGVGEFALAFSSPGLTATQSSSFTVVAAVTFDALSITPGNGQVSLGGGQSQLFVVHARLGGNAVAWPGGTATWTVSTPAAATLVTVNDSTVQVTAAALSANAPLTLTAKLGSTITTNVTLTVIAQAAAASLAVGSTSVSGSGGTAATGSLDAMVLDVNGVKVGGLTAGSYSFDPVTTWFGTVTVTPASITTAPATSSGAFSAALVIDQSGSMSTSDSSSARLAAAKQFAQGMQSSDEAALYTFSTTTALRQTFSSSASVLSAAVDALTFDNGASTALYDAGIQACQYTQGGHNTNRAVVLLTDGGDNASTASIGDVIAACQAAGVRVYAVGFGSGRAEDLGRLASATGGYAVFSTSVSVILSAIRSLPATMRGSARADRLTVNLSVAGGTFPSSGSFTGILRATTSGGGNSSSTYRVAWSAAAPVTLTHGSSVYGALVTGSQVDNYTFATTAANAGFSAYAIRYSSGFDPDLRVAPPAGGAVIGGNLNTLRDGKGGEWLGGIIPTAGTSTLSVRSGAAASGGYDLGFWACAVTNGGTGTGNFSGTLGTADCPYWGPYFAQYVMFTVAAGKSVAMTLTSTAFDAYLYLLDSTGRIVAEDDNSGGGKNARVGVTIPTTGSYIAVVTTAYSYAVGAYTLQMATTAAANANQAVRPSFSRSNGGRDPIKPARRAP